MNTAAPGIILTPELERFEVIRRGFLTVPTEWATKRCLCRGKGGIPCPGFRPSDMALSDVGLRNLLLDMGRRFIDRMKIRGYEAINGDLVIHGPAPSYELNQRISDAYSSAWAEAEATDDPSLVLPFVFERNMLNNPYSDYWMLGRFITKGVWTEIIVPEEASVG